MSSNNNILVKLKNAGYQLNNKFLVEGVSLEVQKGKIVTLIGPNGSGKSTTAKIALGLLKNIEGEVEKFTNKIGYVPQYGGFFEDLSLLDNLKAIAEIVIEDKNLRIGVFVRLWILIKKNLISILLICVVFVLYGHQFLLLASITSLQYLLCHGGHGVGPEASTRGRWLAEKSAKSGGTGGAPGMTDDGRAQRQRTNRRASEVMVSH